jgi:predicted metalloprotease with PDZ domain
MTIIIAAALLVFQQGAAKPEVKYEVSFENREHHEASIAVTFTGVPAGVLEVRMPRSSPGRYALHEFAKNVYSVKAFDGRGQELGFVRPNEHQWNVTGHDGTVRVTYTLFADQSDGTYPGVDISHAHLQMPGTFMFARGLVDRPIRVTFKLPEGSKWKVATQLKPTNDPTTFTAPDLQYFMDSPTEISNFSLREWTEESPGGPPRALRFAIHYVGPEAQIDTLVDLTKRVVKEQEGIFGELPQFDYGTYTFEGDYLPWVNGDGMEHRNSTTLASRIPVNAPLRNMIGTVSHEFFHSWNMERIRAKAIEPFDFERANMSGELWLGEGFTQYYGNLALERAGITERERYLTGTGNTVSYLINAPGRRYFSPIEMSMQAPFVDAATSIDPTNQGNTFISYYTWGNGVALGLDLLLRTEKNSSLDMFMREMWRRHGKPGVPYTLRDIERALAATAKDSAFAAAFMQRYVSGRDLPDYEKLFARMGLLLRKAQPGVVTMGQFRLNWQEGKGIVAAPTQVGTPIYEAGVDAGDQLISIDGRELKSDDDLRAAREGKKPGDSVTIVYDQRGERKTRTLKLVESPNLELVTYEKAGLSATPEMLKLREEWLGSKATTT